MSKSRTIFFCRNCGAQSSKWIGKCPSCGEWNTYEEEVVVRDEKSPRQGSSLMQKQSKPLQIREIEEPDEKRTGTGNAELDRVLGGGLVPGSLILIGGEPGIGKSTLMLQVALQMKKTKVLYISGEESGQQLKMRAERIGKDSGNCFILTETYTRNIINTLEELQPGLVVIDSVQTLQTDLLDSPAGSISQIRECAAEMQKYAKTTNTPVVLIGHITKDGTLAGPKILEHMVDTVLQFEGERNYGYRILRAVKNRFGSTSELGIYEMQSTGLREVLNPSEILLSHRDEDLSGIAVAAMMEGMRPMMIEAQALVGTAAYGTPQRSTTGFDTRRLNMLLAVLEKRSGFRIGAKDVFLNIAGGLRVEDPAIDLAVVCAVLSSSEDIPVDRNVCFAAEVGLSGEIRSVNRLEQRIAEADKLGFGRIFVSKYNLKGVDKSRFRIEIAAFRKIEEVYAALFG